MRPDELAAEEEIRRSQGRDKLLKKGAGLALTAGTAAVGLSAANKILPLLSEYIPLDLAVKGINKINPKIGNFLKKGQSLGLDMKEGLNFVKENLMGKEPEKKKIHPLQEFETNYTDIAQALANTIKQGQSPQAAAGILKNSTAFGKKIKKLEKEVGKNFIDYVLELFGPQGGAMQQPQGIESQQQQQQPQQPQPQQMNQQAQPQGNGLDQQIVAALDKILKM